MVLISCTPSPPLHDYLLTSDNTLSIANVKKDLANQFLIKVLGPLGYFLVIEISRSKRRTVFLQRKYSTNLLKETRMLGSKLANILMDPKAHIYDCKDKEVDT